MLDKDSIFIADVTSAQMREVFESILSIDFNYSITESSQVTIKFIDPQFRMAQNRYFTVGRDLIVTQKSVSPYLSDGTERIPQASNTKNGEFARRSMIYEMASVTVDQSAGNSPVWTVKARPKGIQQMKRDRKPRNIKGSGSQFVINACKKYGLTAVTQKTSKGYKINNAQGAQQATSVWDAMKSIAQEAEFVMFEVDGILYFGQEKWILNKWGTHATGGFQKVDSAGVPRFDSDGAPVMEPRRRFIPFYWPPGSSDNPESELFRLIGIPTLTQSDNDAYVADGSLVCERTNGVRIRPGMTVKIFGVPNFQGNYLVTDVSFQEETTDPVSVTFRSPEKLEKDKIKDIQIGKRVQNVYKVIPGYKEVTSPIARSVTTRSTIDAFEVSPLPTRLRPNVYPTPFFDAQFIVQNGNIDLWNRPVYPTPAGTNQEPKTTEPFIWYSMAGEVYFVLERVWCVGSSPFLLTEQEAITKFDADNLHHGSFSNEDAAKMWIRQLKSVQLAILPERFNFKDRNLLSGLIRVGFCP